MQEKQAKNIINKLKREALKDGYWVDVKEKYRPELKKMVITISLKIDKG